MSILSINGSPNKEGNTAGLAGKVDAGKSGVHNEPFCADVRHGVCRDGHRQ